MVHCYGLGIYRSGRALWTAALPQPFPQEGLAAVASELGLQFFPVRSVDQMGTRGASFVYMDCAPARNCMRGMIYGHETVIFDQDMPFDPVSGRSDGPIEHTVVGFRVAAESFCRDRGVILRTFWHVEKLGEWVFVYHSRPLVKPAGIVSYVEEARARFKVATIQTKCEPTVPAGLNQAT